MKKQPNEFKPGDPIIILDAIDSNRDRPRLCKVKRIEPGGIIGIDQRGIDWFAPTLNGRVDRYIVPDLFHPLWSDGA